MGLVGYGSVGEGQMVKPYSDETNWEIDEEVRNLVREQHQKTRELLETHSDKVKALGEALLEKETLNLQDIIDVLGERPFGMTDTMKEYLEELNARKEKEAQEEQKKDEEKTEGEAEEKSQDEPSEEKSEGEKKD